MTAIVEWCVYYNVKFIFSVAQGNQGLPKTKYKQLQEILVESVLIIMNTLLVMNWVYYIRSRVTSQQIYMIRVYKESKFQQLKGNKDSISKTMHIFIYHKMSFVWLPYYAIWIFYCNVTHWISLFRYFYNFQFFQELIRKT